MFNNIVFNKIGVIKNTHFYVKWVISFIEFLAGKEHFNNFKII